jgi:GNAT superfamily N-acetyltransferase
MKKARFSIISGNSIYLQERERAFVATDLVIRPARMEDIDAMAGLLSVLFAVEEDFSADIDKQRAGLEMFFKHPDGRQVIVAEHQQQVVGMCSAQLLISTAAGGWKAIVEDVVVAEPFRGRGIGKKLLDALAEWAERLGARRMDLLADRNNSAALDFYERLRWRSTNLIALQKSGQTD